ncbi:MAG: PKD domain-containing protein [Bacteroidales bacterium]
MNKYAPLINLGSDTSVSHGFCPYTLLAGPRFTSYLWSTGSTADSIVVNETGEYWVEVVDIFGRTSRDTIHVQYPYTALPDSGLCLTDTISMNTGLDHAYSFLWIDGSTDSLLNIWEPGEYWVQITDSTAAHCSVLDSFVVVADSFPVQASLGPDVSLCGGNEIALVSGMEPGIDYAWSTGDSAALITVYTSGDYSLTVTNSNGCVAKDTVAVNIIGVKPTVAFASNTPCLGDASAFTDLSYAAPPDGVAAWSWDFAGQGTSVQQNPQFEFGAAGDYNIELVVTTDSGCFGDTTIAVHVRSLPQAYFNPTNGCNGQPISFSDETTEGEGSLFSWSWDFGDGHSDTGQNPMNVYGDTGIYTVELISSDIYGCVDTAEREITIRLTPEVDFSFQESCLGLPTAFAETTDMPGWAGIISRTWKFGDGTASSAKNPTHMYSMAGGYPVTLINRSINGCVDSTTKVVLVYPYPVAGFTSGVACEGNEVCFVDTSYVENGVIAQWNWNFGNGHSDTVSAPCTVYADTGFYQVQLEVSSDFGCSSIVSKSIEVHPVPQSDFSLIPEYGIPPLDVQFYNYTQGAIQYNWSFGDGAYSSALNPQHVYNSESIYNIILVSENMFGCTDTASANVYVIPSVLDLVLMNLQVTDSAGYLNLKAQFFNNGTRNIRKVALDARVGNNIPIREEWNGFLEPGQYGQYHFTASFLKPDISNVRLVCMDISTLDSYGQRDTEPENNASCYSLVEDFFIASVFPSPATDYVYADISVPDGGDVEISLISRDGRKLIREVLEDTEAGTLRVKMDLRFLADGMYILHAAFADKTDMYRFVKTTE